MSFTILIPDCVAEAAAIFSKRLQDQGSVAEKIAARDGASMYEVDASRTRQGNGSTTTSGTSLNLQLHGSGYPGGGGQEAFGMLLPIVPSTTISNPYCYEIVHAMDTWSRLLAQEFPRPSSLCSLLPSHNTNAVDIVDRFLDFDGFGRYFGPREAEPLDSVRESWTVSTQHNHDPPQTVADFKLIPARGHSISAMGMHHFPDHKVLVLVTNTDAALTTRSASIPSLPTINPDHHLKRHCIERVKNKKTMYHCPWVGYRNPEEFPGEYVEENPEWMGHFLFDDRYPRQDTLVLDSPSLVLAPTPSSSSLAQHV
ncbi:hypothetical protein C8Q76DRAFT_797855 [Earliella scabrosa]|nr:hypothetical protein C8Q76DRAFT_797855 [Earliella scabrosa]